MNCCDNPQLLEEYLPSRRAKVTTCVTCGAETDCRPLKPQDESWLCQKHGGSAEPCDHGAGKAHHCIHSKWGKLATCGGPCACHPCHTWELAG